MTPVKGGDRDSVHLSSAPAATNFAHEKIEQFWPKSQDKEVSKAGPEPQTLTSKAFIGLRFCLTHRPAWRKTPIGVTALHYFFFNQQRLCSPKYWGLKVPLAFECWFLEWFSLPQKRGEAKRNADQLKIESLSATEWASGTSLRTVFLDKARFSGDAQENTLSLMSVAAILKFWIIF